MAGDRVGVHTPNPTTRLITTAAAAAVATAAAAIGRTDALGRCRISVPITDSRSHHLLGRHVRPSDRRQGHSGGHSRGPARASAALAGATGSGHGAGGCAVGAGGAARVGVGGGVATSAAHRRGAGAGAGVVGEGRGRLSPGEYRAFGDEEPRSAVRALHAARLHRAAEAQRHGDRRAAGGGVGAQQYRRSAGGTVAAAGECHSDGVSFAHAGYCGRGAAGGHPGGRHRQARVRASRLAATGRYRDRRRHQPEAGCVQCARVSPGGRRGFRRLSAGGRSDHPGARRYRPDDHRHVVAEYGARSSTTSAKWVR
eukprot:ctg_615.g326